MNRQQPNLDIKAEDLTDALIAEVLRQFKLTIKQWKRRDGTPMIPPDFDFDTPRPEPPPSTGAALDRLHVLAAIEPGTKGNETRNKAKAIAGRVGFTYSRTSYHLRRLCKQRRVRKINYGSGRGASFYRVESLPPLIRPPRLSAHASRQKVLASINSGEQLSAVQIADRTGISYYTALQRLNDLIKAGKVERIGKYQSTRYKLHDE